MLTKAEKIYLTLLDATVDEARSGIRAWASASVHNKRSHVDLMRSLGYAEVEYDGASHMTPDGVPIVAAAGKYWALPHDVYATRVRESLAAARASRATDNEQRPGESMTSVLCPSCHAVMAKSPVCPRCAKGKAGFKILCICTECGHEVYL